MFLSVDIIYLKITIKEDSKKSEMGYTRRKTKEKKGASEQLYKVSGKSSCPSFLKSVLPAKAWRAILSFRLKKKKTSHLSFWPFFLVPISSLCPLVYDRLWIAFGKYLEPLSQILEKT